MSRSTRKHILFVTIPAYGHLIPLLELAKKLAKYHQITFAVSSNKADQITQRGLLPEGTVPIVSIPDGYYEADHENPLSGALFNRMLATTVPGVDRLLHAVAGVESVNSADALGVTEPVQVVISEITLAGGLKILPERGVPYYLFNPSAASSVLYALLIDKDTPAIPDFDLVEIPFDNVPPPGVEPPPLMQIMKTLLLSIQEAVPLAAAIIANSVGELESDVLKQIRTHERICGVHLCCIGPLLPEAGDWNKLSSKNEIETWLNSKKNSTVIYVSFGTLALPKAENLNEIAKALIVTKQACIWSIPSKSRHHIHPEVLAQFSATDLLLVDWAPQKLILSHPATAVFLSHCGWNSCLESLASGIPVVAWPMFGDQNMNAIELVRMGVATLIEGTGMVSEKTTHASVIQKAIEITSGFSFTSSGSESECRKAAKSAKRQLLTALGPNGSSYDDFAEIRLKLGS